MTTRRSFLLFSTLALAAMPLLPAAQSGPFAPAVTAMASPAGAGSAQPQLTVSRRGVLLSWIEREGTRAALKYSERTASGWSAARVAASGDDWVVNWADVPSMLRLDNGTLVAHWLQKNGSGSDAYDVRLSRSTDDGRTWTPSVRPHADGTKTEHGFASLFEQTGGGLGLIWLDGRNSGAMMLRYGAFDRAWTQTAEIPVDTRVCECCPTAAAVTADGPIVAYRNRTDDEIRDIHVSRFENGKWSESQPVARDNWNITGCPVNGPAIAARNRTVAVAWFSGAEKQNRAFAAFSQDAGRTFGKPIRVDEAGSLGRVDIEVLDDGSAVAAWIEYTSGPAHFRFRRVDPSGALSAPITVATIGSDRSSGYPRLARFGRELVLAWIEGVQPASRVRTAIAVMR